MYVLVFATLAAAAVSGGYILYRSDVDRIMHKAGENLTAIGMLKANEILYWRNRHAFTSWRLAHGKYLGYILDGSPAPPLPEELRVDLRQQTDPGTDVFLFSPGGALLLSTPDSTVQTPDPSTRELREAMEAALARNETAVADLIRADDGKFYFDSVTAVRNAAGEPTGLLVLRSDASQFLFPVVREWPVPSDTSETILVRREGDAVINLNTLRHAPHPPMSKIGGMHEVGLPAVQAALGRVGIVEGTDYRGVPVLADVRPVPESPLFLVSKMDMQEVFAGQPRRLAMIGTIILLLIILAAAIVASLYKRRQAGMERSLQDVQDRFRTYIEKAPEGVFVVDNKGTYLEVNPGAEKISGYSRSELIGKSIADLVDPGDSDGATRHFETLLATGESTDDVRIVTKSGEVRTWQVKAVTLDDTRFLGFAADVTRQREDEQRIRMTNRRAEALMRLPVVFASMSESEFARFALQMAEDLTGSKLSCMHLVGDDGNMLELLSCSRGTVDNATPGRKRSVGQACPRAVAVRRREPVVINDYAAHPDKHGPLEDHFTPDRLVTVPVIEGEKVVMLTDVANKACEYTEWDVETVRLLSNETWQLIQRHRDSEAVRRSWESVTNVIEASPVPFALNDEHGRVTYLNAAFRNTFGYTPADIPTLEDWWPKAYPDPAYREQLKALWAERIEEMARTGRFKELEARIQCKDGRIRTVLATAAPLSQLSPGNSIVNLYDITERKDAETRILTLSQLYLALSECNKAIVRARSQNELFETVCAVVAEHAGVRMAWIGLAQGEDGAIKKLAARGHGTEYLDPLDISAHPSHPFGKDPADMALREGRPIWIQDFSNDPLTAPWHEHGARFGWASCASLPLTHEGKPVGVLTLYSDRIHAFDQQARDLFLEIARNVSFAIGVFAQEEKKTSAERDLQFSRDMLAKVLNASPQAIFWKDRNSIYLGCNKAFARNAGLARPEDVIGKSDFDLSRPKKDAEGYIADDAEVMATNTPKLHYNEQLQTADGRRIWIDTSKVPLTDSSGRVYGVLGIVEDITARKAANDELLRLRAAVEQSANIIVITNPQGLIEYVNPAFEETTGYSAQEAIGQNPRLISSGKQGAEFYRDLWSTIRSGRSWSGQFHNRRKNGSLFWESATISPVLGPDGEIRSFIAVKQDITERKLLESDLHEAKERAEAANRAKSEFLAVMSHELRTPLNGVLGFAELLSDSPLNEEQVEFVRTIRSSGSHLLQVVNDILDFSSIEQKGVSLEINPLAISDLVESATIVIENSAEEKGIDFRCEIAPDMPGIIQGDALRIRQVLINLLGNAVKFTSSGSVVLRIAMASQGSRQFVDFSVQDTGPRIPSETVDLLFQPFTQADSTHSRRFKGTGLGLAISLRLARAMGGELSVESTPGTGSTFTFRLPYLAMENQIDAESLVSPPALLPQPQRGEEVAAGRPVLIVEDDRVSSALAGKVVSLLGYDVELASDGGEAIDAFVPGKYAAILMDMQMPTVDGIEATTRIRAIEKESGMDHVPIIALTANVMPGDRERCIAAGMDEFLTKPLDRDTLGRKLAELVSKA